MLTQGQTRWNSLPTCVMLSPSLPLLLARSFLSGEPTLEQLVFRAAQALGRRRRWMTPLARRYLKAFPGQTRPREREVVRFLYRDWGFRNVSAEWSRRPPPGQWLIEPQRMQPVAAAAHWELPVIESPAQLAKWLELTLPELQWFADLRGLERRRFQPGLRHYHYRVLIKLSGSVRLIESPKPRLKALQRRILSQILERIPSHPAAHGFIKRRSIKTFVAPHTGQRVVLRMDLTDFFPSIIGARIQTFFRTAGHPESVADLLGALCTNAAPGDVWGSPGLEFDVSPVALREARRLYSRIHLPQGAPTSPALANLCSFRADCRLAGLAKSAGARYTRYADDLAFSGGETFDRCVDRFSIHAAAILSEEGYAVHHRKTRLMRQGVRQHLAGLVANRRVNVLRTDFDHLKAILTNCVRHGPDSQNREAHLQFRSHLEGRVAFVEMVNPGKGKRLRAILDQIRWS